MRYDAVNAMLLDDFLKAIAKYTTNKR